jgi:hypothetical protein
MLVLPPALLMQLEIRCKDWLQLAQICASAQKTTKVVEREKKPTEGWSPVELHTQVP